MPTGSSRWMLEDVFETARPCFSHPSWQYFFARGVWKQSLGAEQKASKVQATPLVRMLSTWKGGGHAACSCHAIVRICDH